VIWLIVTWVCLSLSALARANAAKGGPKEVFVKVERPFLTVKAKEIPARRIVEGNAQQLNYELIINGPLVGYGLGDPAALPAFTLCRGAEAKDIVQVQWLLKPPRVGRPPRPTRGIAILALD
jgi:hypothetical protein